MTDDYSSVDKKVIILVTHHKAIRPFLKLHKIPPLLFSPSYCSTCCLEVVTNDSQEEFEFNDPTFIYK